ncbi:hypothetical protein CEXT_537271 [Caerostris extrusa]|uniref:Uncharacterized protein n=1 Tax=Caerostris extrusa TaxID=172846 RepID=A0AAV4RZN3_CAEEX|nr:hypothetical protein CEXT_537271 [Caerostris extrusa]
MWDEGLLPHELRKLGDKKERFLLPPFPLSPILLQAGYRSDIKEKYFCIFPRGVCFPYACCCIFFPNDHTNGCDGPPPELERTAYCMRQIRVHCNVVGF